MHPMSIRSHKGRVQGAAKECPSGVRRAAIEGAGHMKDTKKNASVEDALMEQLRYGGFDKQNLADLVKVAASIHKGGLEHLRGFPLGKPPIVDGLRLSGDIGLDAIGPLLQEILPKTSRVSGLRLFPKGIPWPEVYHVDVDLGAPVQQQRGF